MIYTISKIEEEMSNMSKRQQSDDRANNSRRPSVYLFSYCASNKFCLLILYFCNFTTSSTTALATTTTAQPTTDADQLCVQKRGTGSHLCRYFYNQDYSSICTKLYCAIPNTNTCYENRIQDYILCGNKKWCISGVCTSDSNAPAGDETCLYGDRTGRFFSNSWTCADMVREAPQWCADHSSACCASCASIRTTTITTPATTTTPAKTTTSPTTISTDAFSTTTIATTTTVQPITDADQLCVQKRGTGSHLCRYFYNQDYSSICTKLYCAIPNTNTCYENRIQDYILCGNKKWCISGVCTSDSNAPAGDETCLYGDRTGRFFSNSWTCADMVREAPQWCADHSSACCASCASIRTTTITTHATTTTPVKTTTSPTTISTDAFSTTTIATTTTVQPITDADQLCVQKRGTGSHLCRYFFNQDYSSICTKLYCAIPNTNTCYENRIQDYIPCGNKKWCISGVCTADSNAPAGDETCLYGDRKGSYFSNGWTCADMVREAPQWCADHANACCASCASIRTTTTPTTPSRTTTPITTVQPKTTEDTSFFTGTYQTDNYSLILGLAVGIPFFVILLVFTILLCICCKGNKQQKTKPKVTEKDQGRRVQPVPKDENFFDSYVAKGYNCYGGKTFQSLGGYWDNRSFEYPESIGKKSYLGNKSSYSGQSEHSFNGNLPNGQRNQLTANRQNHNGRLSHTHI